MGGAVGEIAPPPDRSGEKIFVNQKLSQTIKNHFLKGKNRSASGGFAPRPPPRASSRTSNHSQCMAIAAVRGLASTAPPPRPYAYPLRTKSPLRLKIPSTYDISAPPYNPLRF